jgi:hypothetical protein
VTRPRARAGGPWQPGVGRHQDGRCGRSLGGAGAPDDLRPGVDTQSWLAVSGDPGARAGGRYLYHRVERPTHPAATRPEVQDRLLESCRALTGNGI